MSSNRLLYLSRQDVAAAGVTMAEIIDLLEEKDRVTPREISKPALDRLQALDWPGNVRELENLIERAMILHRGEPLRFDLGESRPTTVREDLPAAAAEPLDLDSLVTRHIRRVLGMTNGKIHGPGGAGELLGINPNTLRYKMRKLGIPFRKQVQP